MNRQELDQVLTAALADRRLLDHPFYRRWQAGEVSLAELRDDAAQYRHFETALPGVLRRLAGSLPDGVASEAVTATLSDELGDPVAHVELFEGFACAVGAVGTEAQPASPATAALLDAYSHALDQGPWHALAAVVAYESQASEVASSKAEGLRDHYGLGDDAVRFWDHHAAVDRGHRDWMLTALATSPLSEDETTRSLKSVADAWWAFLDERDERKAA